MPLLKNINNSIQQKKVVLVAPLDWGLGHATRCVPIIRELIKLDCEVIIASSGKQQALLEREFPNVRFSLLPGYNIQYASTGLRTYIKILTQIPRLKRAINAEKKWLDNFLNENKVDLIISDNRYGLFRKEIYSVIIIHQLAIKTTLGKFVDEQLRRIHYRYLEKFHACWVPDEEGSNNLAGQLSHPKKLPSTTIEYVGPLSRFEEREKVIATIDLLILLSGPEPQRTIFEAQLIHELKSFQGSVVMVRGLPGLTNEVHSTNTNLTVYNHLDAEAIFTTINHSSLIISRSGYSTVMDLLPLNKKCIFIPTPGQPEQYYLAGYLERMGYCLSFPQQRFSLQRALEAAQKFSPTRSSTGFSKVYKKILLETLRY